MQKAEEKIHAHSFFRFILFFVVVVVVVVVVAAVVAAADALDRLVLAFLCFKQAAHFMAMAISRQ